MCVDPVAFE